MQKRAADYVTNDRGAAVLKLVLAALLSTLISTLLAAICGPSLGRASSHLLFVVVVGVAGMLLGPKAKFVGRLDASVVFVFFLFGPIGPVLLHQQVAPRDLGAALFLGIVVAYFFRRKGMSEEPSQPEKSS